MLAFDVADLARQLRCRTSAGSGSSYLGSALRRKLRTSSQRTVASDSAIARHASRIFASADNI